VVLFLSVPPEGTPRRRRSSRLPESKRLRENPFQFLTVENNAETRFAMPRRSADFAGHSAAMLRRRASMRLTTFSRDGLTAGACAVANTVGGLSRRASSETSTVLSHCVPAECPADGPPEGLGSGYCPCGERVVAGECTC
jgi:hypothetical protein